jgi:uncharacterized protein (UPF0332 family)
MNDDVVARYMAEADSIVALAERLLAEDQTRSACSRAYYAMFYAATAMLASRGISVSKHAGVLGAIGHHFSRTGLIDRKYHQFLVRGFETRNTADYELSARLTHERAQEQVAHAREFIAAARDYLATHQPSDSSGEEIA